MLIVTRRVGEVLRIGEEVSVMIVGLRGKQVRLGITAPQSIAVHREEIVERIAEEKQAASPPGMVEPVRTIVRIESKRGARRGTAL
jgi:carbon storage regulator